MLMQILKLIKKEYTDIWPADWKNLKLATQTKDELWNEVFPGINQYLALRESKKQKLEFTYFIQTDGTRANGLFVNLKRPTKTSIVKEEKKKLTPYWRKSGQQKMNISHVVGWITRVMPLLVSEILRANGISRSLDCPGIKDSRVKLT